MWWDLKPIIPNPFHEKIWNGDKAIKDYVLKNSIKVNFLNEIAKNFWIYQNFNAPTWITEVENYFVKNDKLKSLIEKEKLTMEEFDEIRDNLQDELNNYISNMKFKDKILKSETSENKLGDLLWKVKYAWIISKEKLQSATTLSKDALGLAWKHKWKVALSWLVLVSMVNTVWNYIDASKLQKQAKIEMLSQDLKVSKPKDLALLNWQQLFEEVVNRADSYNSNNITGFLEDNFLYNNNYKNFIEWLTKNPYKNWYGFDVWWNENIKRVILIQKWIKEHNLNNNVYIDSEVEKEKRQLESLNKYLENFSSTSNRDTSFTEWWLLFEVKENDMDWKTYLDISNI